MYIKCEHTENYIEKFNIIKKDSFYLIMGYQINQITLGTIKVNNIKYPNTIYPQSVNRTNKNIKLISFMH